MKKYLILSLTLFCLYVKGQTPTDSIRYEYYMTPDFQNHVSNAPEPLVAIFGNFSNLKNKPTTLSGYGITASSGDYSAFYYPLTGNPSSFLTGITSSQITTALGFTPISAVTTNAILSKTGNYTIVSGDLASGKMPTLYLNFDCTSGSLTCILPTASSYSGYQIFVTKTDASANTLTVSGLNQDNIIGVQYSSKTAISDGSTWRNN